MPDDAGEASATAARLRPFAESTYLHQVVERRRDGLRRYPDLEQALRAGGLVAPPAAAPGDSGPGQREWRIHFHVPLFTAEYEGLGSSQDVVRAVLAEVRRDAVTPHLEIETYTWQVLPEGLKIELGASIAREYGWVLREWSALDKPEARSQKPEG